MEGSSEKLNKIKILKKKLKETWTLSNYFLNNKIAKAVSYPMLRMTHPSRNFFVLSLLCVLMLVCMDERSGHSRKISKRRMMSNLNEETKDYTFPQIRSEFNK